MKPVVIFLGDGMADEPSELLGGRTPLQLAKTPNMDAIARNGRCGTLLTLPDGFPTSSDVANMSVLGCDLATELCGRGPLEAASQGIQLGANDLCFRMNFTTTDANGILRDFSGGHISQKDAEAAVALLNDRLGTQQIRFYPGVSYRNLLVLSGPEFSAQVACDKPDDNHGNPVAEHLPKAKSPAAEPTAHLLRELQAKAAEILAGRPANGVWFWSGGKAGSLHTIPGRYGIRGAVVSAVDVINGLGRCMGLDVVKVQGATGYIDTNYEGKADAAIAAAKNHDLVYVHLEATDEVSHAQDVKLKIQAIEDFDSRLIGRVMAALGDKASYVVLPDHPVPLAIGKHTRTPVPVAVWRQGDTPDQVDHYDELSCLGGTLGAMKKDDLMNYLFA